MKAPGLIAPLPSDLKLTRPTASLILWCVALSQTKYISLVLFSAGSMKGMNHSIIFCVRYITIIGSGFVRFFVIKSQSELRP